MRGLKIDIARQGAVCVNAGYIHATGGGVVCGYIDMASKRAKVSGYGRTDNKSAPHIYLEADDDTLHTSETEVGHTTISFPEYAGWRVFMAEVSRYTLAFCLTRE